MKYDPDSKTLRFATDDELDTFHAELSELLREATITASSSAEAASEGASRAREVLQRFHVVGRALNAMRRSLPRKGS